MRPFPFFSSPGLRVGIVGGCAVLLFLSGRHSGLGQLIFSPLQRALFPSPGLQAGVH